MTKLQNVLLFGKMIKWLFTHTAHSRVTFATDGSHELQHSNYYSNSKNDYEIFWRRPWIIDNDLRLSTRLLWCFLLRSHMPNLNYEDFVHFASVEFTQEKMMTTSDYRNIYHDNCTVTRFQPNCKHLKEKTIMLNDAPC